MEDQFKKQFEEDLKSNQENKEALESIKAEAEDFGYEEVVEKANEMIAKLEETADSLESSAHASDEQIESLGGNPDDIADDVKEVQEEAEKVIKEAEEEMALDENLNLKDRVAVFLENETEPFGEYPNTIYIDSEESYVDYANQLKDLGYQFNGARDLLNMDEARDTWKRRGFPVRLILDNNGRQGPPGGMRVMEKCVTVLDTRSGSLESENNTEAEGAVGKNEREITDQSGEQNLSAEESIVAESTANSNESSSENIEMSEEMKSKMKEFITKYKEPGFYSKLNKLNISEDAFVDIDREENLTFFNKGFLGYSQILKGEDLTEINNMFKLASEINTARRNEKSTGNDFGEAVADSFILYRSQDPKKFKLVHENLRNFFKKIYTFSEENT